jgi:hypothetical protein
LALQVSNQGCPKSSILLNNKDSRKLWISLHNFSNMLNNILTGQYISTSTELSRNFPKFLQARRNESPAFL